MSFFSDFLLKPEFLCLFFLLFPLLHFDFTDYFYILVLCLVFGNINWEVLAIIEQIMKNVFTVEFLTVANTLSGCWVWILRALAQLNSF